jgi:hypothetical protein
VDAVKTHVLRRLGVAAVVAAGLLALGTEAHAQTAGTRLFFYGLAGGSALGDDEGWLGGGPIGGVGGGARINERVLVEGIVTTTRHEQTGTISFEGRPTVSGGRFLYLFGNPATPVRAFAGGGVGIGMYTGKRIDSSPIIPGRPVFPSNETSTNRLGLTTEAGGGIEIRAGRHFFVRPEGWLALMHTESKAGIEAPLMLPRAAVSVGVIF